MKSMYQRTTLVIIFLGIFLGGFAVEPINEVSAQTSGENNSTICVASPPNASNYPNIDLEIRAIDQNYNSIPGLTAGDVQILDNDKPAAISSFVSNSAGIGADIYFIIDQGNRTNQSIVRAALRRFGEKFMIDGKDRVTIITTDLDVRRNNPRVFLPLTNSLTDFIAGVNNLALESSTLYLPAYEAHAEALNQLRGDVSTGCSRPRYIISIMSDDELSASEISKVSALAFQLRVPVHVVHVARNNLYTSSSAYEQLATSTYGLYEQVQLKKEGDFTELDPSIFSVIKNSRQSYSIQYRTQDGYSGSHAVSVQWAAFPQQNAYNTSEYTVTLSPPEIILTTPVDGSVIERKAAQNTGKTFLYDIETQTVQFQLGWPDGHPRSITTASLLVQSGVGTETVASIQPSDTGTLSFEWDMREISAEGDNPVVLQVTVVDELGYSSTSQPINLLIRNTIPASVVNSITSPTISYVLIGLGVVVIALIIIVIIFWKKLSKIASGGVVGQVVNQIRKTIVGGTRRGKPLAILKVIDGPSNVIGQELKVFTESVKLGRDPSQADFTFYSDANSSISGLHARLEKVNGNWRIVAISKSNQETFVDGNAIPMLEPQAIHDGQVIRLGYPAQQCVELEFHSENISEPVNPSRKTKITNNGEMAVGSNKNVTKVQDNLDDETSFITPVGNISQNGRQDNRDDYDDYFEQLRNR